MLFLAVVTVAILAASVLVSARIPSFSFYLLPTRAWEVGVDVGPEVALVVDLPPRVRGKWAGLGASAVVALASFATGETRGFPGRLPPAARASTEYTGRGLRRRQGSSTNRNVIAAEEDGVPYRHDDGHNDRRRPIRGPSRHRPVSLHAAGHDSRRGGTHGLFARRAVTAGALAAAGAGQNPGNKKARQAGLFWEENWCPEEDSNLHASRHTDLNRARLPIPPSGQRAADVSGHPRAVNALFQTFSAKCGESLLSRGSPSTRLWNRR